ncbi:unnamed protein product [Triticum turgidum subsp. durum]|uniref:Meiosis-specific protein ASY3-like coiled-coil domain-containing protein n=1 Tax=Triticum turgidum subsp. durum TaxID=4567 RepID=A0A9R0TN87_TRITD|nr:unnamed protein product [Triticum turgidum subsp. durum]
MSEERRWSVLVPLFKNIGDFQSCTSYREIKPMSHTNKLWERVIEHRLTRMTSVSKNQFGFVPERSTMEAIFLVTMDIQGDIPWCMLFADDVVLVADSQMRVNRYKSRKWLSDVDSPDRSPPENLDRKSHLKEGRRGKRRLPSPIPFATSRTQETIMSDKEPVQCPDDYLTRAFDQLLVVLGRFQTKIKSETRNKSSQILAGTGEIIRQHLEGVEVQMQDDVDKLVNAGKSKRKRLESTFEEQQELLRVLHEKFKEEVNQQLLGCKNSLEEFEAYHAELKGVADKQKASHKKLLQHAERTVASQLNDAEIKISEVQKRARKKMNGLKHVLKELITETAD